MPLMWSTSLETGIREIDLQHQELLEIANELERCVRAGDVAGAATAMLPRLGAYVLFHFGTEEWLAAGVPDAAAHFAAHAAEHQTFARRVAALREAPPCAEEMLAFIDYLHGWLAEHIGKADRELAAQIRAHRAGTHGAPLQMAGGAGS
jgi:hemerythrin